MKYIRLFGSVEARNAALQNVDYSVLQKTDGVGIGIVRSAIGPTPPGPDPTIPFYVENITDEVESLEIYIGTIPMDIEYSTDNANWNTLPEIDENIVGMSVNPGDKVYLRTQTDYWCSEWGDGAYCNIFQGTISKIGGNIMSLFYGEDFTGEETEFPTQGNYTSPLGGVFGGNGYLIDASELIIPATTMPDACCYEMFDGCTSLTTAPVLPATTLSDYCYYCMFCGCTNLNYIKCLATDISAYNCLLAWADGVAASGTFVKNPSMSSWTTGINGIPANWTVQDAA